MCLQIHESVGHAIELDRILGWEAAFAGTSWLDLAQLGSAALRLGADEHHHRPDPPGRAGQLRLRRRGHPGGQAVRGADGIWVGVLAGRDSAARGRARLRRQRARRRLGPAADGADDQRRPGARPAHARARSSPSTDDGVFMENNRSWSIDDKRLNFQFGCEIAYEVKNGKLGRMLRNPTYTGIGPKFWQSMDMLSSEIESLGHAELRQGPADARSGTPATRPRRPASRTSGWGCGHERRRLTAEQVLDARGAGAARGRDRRDRRRGAPGADPVRELAHPPERRRGHRHACGCACTSTAARSPRPPR